MAGVGTLSDRHTRHARPIDSHTIRTDLLAEGAWGADPLEFVGGFHQLTYGTEARFRSSLPSNGTATWATMEAKSSGSSSTSANVSLGVGYDNVDWDFLKTVYGWAAVQYQAWARGELLVRGNDTQHVIFHTDAIMEYWVDDVHYFGGDFYTFRKAPPVLHLAPGIHKIELRLWRDVRAFGGINEPTIDVLVDVQKVSGGLELARPDILLSDVVDGKLASPLASVYLRNSGEEDIEIVDIAQPEDVRTPVSLAADMQVVLACIVPSLTSSQSTARPPNDVSGIVLVSGQTRPLAFNVSLPSRNTSSSSVVHFTISYKTPSEGKLRTLKVSQPLVEESIYSSHKITFLHPGGMVSYAMLRPPAKNATCHSGRTALLPVVIANHGAGLEADNPMVAHGLDPVADLCAWVLFPTGVTPWSGDDWRELSYSFNASAVD